VIALSCGIKISAVRHLVLSQSTRVTDRQTDRRTDRITTPKTALAYARAVITFVVTVHSVFSLHKLACKGFSTKKGTPLCDIAKWSLLFYRSDLCTVS